MHYCGAELVESIWALFASSQPAQHLWRAVCFLILQSGRLWLFISFSVENNDLQMHPLFFQYN